MALYAIVPTPGASNGGWFSSDLSRKMSLVYIATVLPDSSQTSLEKRVGSGIFHLVAFAENGDVLDSREIGLLDPSQPRTGINAAIATLVAEQKLAAENVTKTQADKDAQYKSDDAMIADLSKTHEAIVNLRFGIDTMTPEMNKQIVAARDAVERCMKTLAPKLQERMYARGMWNVISPIIAVGGLVYAMYAMHGKTKPFAP